MMTPEGQDQLLPLCGTEQRAGYRGKINKYSWVNEVEARAAFRGAASPRETDPPTRDTGIKVGLGIRVNVDSIGLNVPERRGGGCEGWRALRISRA